TTERQRDLQHLSLYLSDHNTFFHRSLFPPPSIAEQRVRLNEFENYVEEERDEQDERTREKTEQWSEFHYDGLYPHYPRGW
uniref:Unique cartilage matrix-associated protein n=1 Tax=Oncorhynchus kisutch TaxID=8019 RepID=A0A8C7JD92_ONCKI